MEELLFASAPLALEAAPSLCGRNRPSGESCAWYHGVWQYFRILGVVASPWMQLQFYESALSRLAAAGAFRRVLISGASDYAMLAVVQHAYRLASAVPEITVVDCCETPLLLNRWFAERQGISIDTWAGDIVDYCGSGPFDLICTHSFFGNFVPERRPAVVARWWELLRPGGKLVTVNRIRPGVQSRQGFTVDQAADFKNRLLAAGRQHETRLGISQEKLENWAAVYTARYCSYPVASLAYLDELLQVHGFSIDSLDPGEVPVCLPSGPSTAGQAMRARLVATRL